MQNANSSESTEAIEPAPLASGGADGYEIVRRLLERQDAVLEQLRELENRVQQTVERFVGKTESREGGQQVAAEAA